MTYAHGTRLLDYGPSLRIHRRETCPECDLSTLPQTVLEAIRRYEHIGRIPYGQRLDVQPCEMTR